MKRFYEIEEMPLLSKEQEDVFNEVNNDCSFFTTALWNNDTSLFSSGEKYRLDDKNFSFKTNINYVLSPQSNRLAYLPLKPNGKRKLLIPYQTSGVITAPGDIVNGHKKNFWERLFEAFFKFLSFPFQLVAYTWECFAKTLVGDGSPQNISKGWIGESDLYKKKKEIPSQSNPLIPADMLPKKAVGREKLSVDQVGLALFVRKGYESRQYIDSEGILKNQMDYKNFSDQLAGWRIDPHANELVIGWLSNDHWSNDGSIYGSFAVLEEV